MAPVSIDLYLPAFPAIAQSLHAEQGDVERTLAVFFIGLAFGQLFHGPLADRFGRRGPLLAGMLLYSAGALGCMLSRSAEALMVWRFVQAVGGCAGMVISRAVVRDRLGPREGARALSMMMLVMGVAPILGPLLGGWLLSVMSWRAIFGVMLAYGLACCMAVFFLLEETLTPDKVQPLQLLKVLRNYGRLVRDRSFMGLVLAGGFVQLGMFAYVAGSSYVLIQVNHIDPQHFGWVFGVNAMGFIIATQVNARLLRYAQPQQILSKAVIGFGALCLAILVIALSGHSALLVLLPVFFLYMGGFGFVGPNTMALALAGQGQMAGTASGLLGTIQFGFGTVAGILVSLHHDGTAAPLMFVMAGAGLTGLACYLLLAKRS